MRGFPNGDMFFLGAWVDGLGSGPKDSSAAAAALSGVFGAKSSFYCSKSTCCEILSQKYTFGLFFAAQNQQKNKQNRDSFEIYSRDPRQIIMCRAQFFSKIISRICEIISNICGNVGCGNVSCDNKTKPPFLNTR